MYAAIYLFKTNTYGSKKQQIKVKQYICLLPRQIYVGEEINASAFI